MLSRRSFIRNSSILAAGSMFDFKMPGEKKMDKIGLQLYTLRDIIGKDPQAIISSVAKIGFQELEIYGYSPENHFWGLQPKAFKNLLDANGLTAPGSHVLFESFFTPAAPEEIKRFCEVANAIGNKYIVFPILNEKQRQKLSDYQVLSEKLNQAGRIVKQEGLQFAYHNHDFEFMPLENGRCGYDVILEATDPSLVKFELDLFWATKAGKDPVNLFRQNPGRFVLWHVKDMDKQTQTFTEVGTGVIDFKTIFANQDDSGVQHFFIEQDVITGNPMQSIEKSFSYVKRNLI